MYAVTEVDLDRFFDCTAERMDIGVPWPYCDLKYRTISGDWSVEFFVSPSFREAKLALSLFGRVVYDLDTQYIADLRIHDDPEHATLEIAVSGEHSVFLRLQPAIFVGQKAGNGH